MNRFPHHTAIILEEIIDLGYQDQDMNHKILSRWLNNLSINCWEEETRQWNRIIWLKHMISSHQSFIKSHIECKITLEIVQSGVLQEYDLRASLTGLLLRQNYIQNTIWMKLMFNSIHLFHITFMLAVLECLIKR